MPGSKASEVARAFYERLHAMDAELVDGRRYTNDNIAVFETENGLVRTYRDYFDPRRFQLVVDAVSGMAR